VAESPRIDELRRRVDSDPASIAFAQLAEEYRRAGDYEQAVRVSRAGLAQHPNYLSARVTLGRALLELQQLDEAQTELGHVLRAAPDNLAAIRALAEIHQRRGELDDALEQVSTAHPIGRDEAPRPAPPPDYTRAVEALDAITLHRPSPSITAPEDPPSRFALRRGPAEASAEADPALRELESWLEDILADRESRGQGRLPTPSSQPPGVSG
jgi:tetratricopeptide (TPR) repeat protein